MSKDTKTVDLSMEKYTDIIKKHGLTQKEIENQLKIFKTGIPFVNIVAPAEIGTGIEQYLPEEEKKYITVFENEKNSLDLLKFVPASGAATRMFKFLHQYLSEFNLEEDDLDEYINGKDKKDLKRFFDSYEDFAFYDTVIENLKMKFPDFLNYDRAKQYYLFVWEMLSESGLDFSHTPKGLIPFHKENHVYRTAFEEQLYEAAFYAKSKGVSKLHFTVSEEHLAAFRERYNEIIEDLKEEVNSDFEISYSFQKKKTDTIAATMENEIFLDDSGSPVFRPGGHGALIENLNELDADIIFIKNIDNVIVRDQVPVIAYHKKVLAGRLIELQKQIFNYLRQLEKEDQDKDILKEITRFIHSELKINISSSDSSVLLSILNRPIRVCGVVENTGAPGGGPFLIKDKNGRESFQIVEKAEIDTSDSRCRELVERATHFNPVDLVCGVRDYLGNKFDLSGFSNPESGFISTKSYQGETIKALERPGLWNGAMAGWITVFVEVPLITFNPVKKVVDLLDKAHQ